MNNSPIQTPKNTTKRTGIGCSAIGFLLFITAICVFIAGLIFKLEHTYIAIGGTLLAFGIISLIGGIGLFFKGRQVDKILSGEDLIARLELSWLTKMASAKTVMFTSARKGSIKTDYMFSGQINVFCKM